VVEIFSKKLIRRAGVRSDEKPEAPRNFWDFMPMACHKSAFESRFIEMMVASCLFLEFSDCQQPAV
jgi:hypothetical protein